MSMLKRKGKTNDDYSVNEAFEEPGIEYTIPETKKVLSLGKLLLNLILFYLIFTCIPPMQLFCDI